MTSIEVEFHDQDEKVEEKPISYKTMMVTLYTIFFCAALFLAQARFFDVVVPFFIPFWAIVCIRYERFKTVVLIGGLIGALQLAIGQGVILALEVLLFEAIRRFRYGKLSIPVATLLSIAIVQIVWQAISYRGIPPFSVQIYIADELIFAGIMLLLLYQFFLPMHEFWTKPWTYERIGAGLVIIAVVITGMKSFAISYFALMPLVLHLVICVAAVIGGMQATVVVAVTVAIFVSITQLSFTGMMALYAVTGVVVGASVKMGRLMIAVMSLIPSVLFYLYDATLPLDPVYFVSIVTATIIFVLIPQRYIHGAAEMYEQQMHLSNTEQQVYSVATDHLIQFQQFVDFMKELVFDRFTTVRHANAYKPIEPLSICASCFRYDQCWDNKEHQMSKSIEQWLLTKVSNKPLEIVRAEQQLKVKCVKSSKLLEELETKLHKEHLNGQFYHGKKMVALQLRDLSYHLEQLLADMKSGHMMPGHSEQQMIEHLQEHGIQCFRVNWQSHVVGELAFTCDIVCPDEKINELYKMTELLSHVLGEPLKEVEMKSVLDPFHYIEVCFQSAVRYKLEYDIYKQTKTGVQISGDAHAVFPLHAGLVAIMLSDGMGTNRSAQRESTRLIQMMRDCLHYNMDPETAMHTMHYVLSLKNEDMYATIDFALIDLQLGTLWCWKAGGMTTYVLRGAKLFKIESKAAPIGFMPVFTIETENIGLLAEDFVIMVSDGLFSSTADWVQQETFFLQLIRNAINRKINLNVLLYEAMTQYKQRYTMDDDCTVMLFKMSHMNPQWSVFRPATEQFI